MKMRVNQFHLSVRQILVGILVVLILLVNGGFCPSVLAAQTGDSADPPETPVKLIFIHHSCGENLLDDGNGGLGLSLAENNYFVSDTNYGWGPDGIGDRTDILDWPEWFLGENSTTYTNALFHESGQNAAYTRLFDDPGGENQIIMFKSCFPNSDLGGSPTDAPGAGNELTVGSAKQVYLDLLDFFRAHPDKLFVVLTAPPMRYPAHPENARAFNTWLVQDWLQDANYPYDNVAVWDFYTVLTGVNNHHMFSNGQVIYINDQGGNTHAYPNGDDDHPSQTGNLKAVQEFVPMLNVFYNRWYAAAPLAEDQDQNQPTPQDSAATQPQSNPSSVQGNDALPGTFQDAMDGNGLLWECFADETASTTVSCNLSDHALLIKYAVAPQSWATTVAFLSPDMTISETAGLDLRLRAPLSDANFNVIIYRGDADNRETYLYPVRLTSGTDWQQISIPWQDFRRAEWESADQESLTPGAISGVGFGMDGSESEGNSGELQVDEIQWLAGQAQPAEQSVPDVQSDSVQSQEPQEPESDAGGPSLCPGAGALLLAVLLAGVSLHRIRLLL